MEYKIVHERDHVIITDIQGNFICSCDNYQEATQEINTWKKTKSVQKNVPDVTL
jgi:hypothetical protein